jgi:hypothetical protein
VIDRLADLPACQPPDSRRDRTPGGGEERFARLAEQPEAPTGTSDTARPRQADATPTAADIASVPSPPAHVEQRASAEQREAIVSLPWRLRAQAGLSWRSIENYRAQVALEEFTPPLVRNRGATEQGGSDDIIDRKVLRPASAATAAAIPTPPSISTSVPLERAAAGEHAERVGAQASAAATAWPQRSLRWIPDDPRGATVWVRDYTLSTADADSLLADLFRESAAQGTPLRRVMLNGHELWRAPATQD